MLTTLESPLDWKEIQPVHPKDQSWIFIWRTDGAAEAPTLWPPDAKKWPIRKDPSAGKDCRQDKGTTEDEMVGWHHWLDGHEFGQALGVGDGQGSLASWSPWGHKESDMTEWLNWTELVLLIDHVSSSLAYNSTELAWENLLGSSTRMLPIMVPSDHLLSTPSFCFSSLSFGKTAPSPF